MDVCSKQETVVTVTFNEREAKLLTCLIEGIGPTEAEDDIQRSPHFNKWIVKLERREVVDFTGTLYGALLDLF